MAERSPVLSLSFDSPLPPGAVFDALAVQLAEGLARRGVTFEPKPVGAIRALGAEVGAIAGWEPGREIRLRWRPAPWDRSVEVEVRVGFELAGTGSRIRWEVEGWDRVVGAAEGDLTDWVASDLLPAFLARLLPDAVGDWITDRRARRPSGASAIEVYRDPSYHWPNFWLILDRIRLSPSDRLLEVGCGGGAFLREALGSGCRAVAVDHSPSMVRLAREVNREAVVAGRLEVLEGEADRLPVPDASATCCVSTGAIGFFPDPLRALREMHRALAPEGRLAVFAGTAVLRGTPAAPEPIASRVRFFTSEELSGLAREAGFEEVQVDAPDLEPYARKAGLPEDIVAFFHGDTGALLLTARRGKTAQNPRNSS